MSHKKIIGYQKGQLLTVGIPTCYGGDSLVQTVKSLAASQNVDQFRLIIWADRNPISKSNLQQLKKLGAEVYWNDQQGSQYKKLRQIIDITDSKLFVFTQDDILFEKNTLAKLVKAFKVNPQATTVVAQALPLPADNFFEQALGTSLRVVNTVGAFWKNADNYLLANGRCMAFKTSMIKKFRTPEVTNLDMFFYLENKRLAGTFVFVPKSRVFISFPQSLKEHLNPSSRFQYSKDEMQLFFNNDISGEYQIPFSLLALGYLKELLEHPISAGGYIFIYLYTRLNKKSKQIALNNIWQIELSTKKVLPIKWSFS